MEGQPPSTDQLDFDSFDVHDSVDAGFDVGISTGSFNSQNNHASSFTPGVDGLTTNRAFDGTWFDHNPSINPDLLTTKSPISPEMQQDLKRGQISSTNHHHTPQGWISDPELRSKDPIYHMSPKTRAVEGARLIPNRFINPANLQEMHHRAPDMAMTATAGGPHLSRSGLPMLPMQYPPPSSNQVQQPYYYNHSNSIAPSNSSTSIAMPPGLLMARQTHALCNNQVPFIGSRNCSPHAGDTTPQPYMAHHHTLRGESSQQFLEFVPSSAARRKIESVPSPGLYEPAEGSIGSTTNLSTDRTRKSASRSLASLDIGTGEKATCIEGNCKRGVRLPGGRCKRHQDKYDRNNAPAPSLQFMPEVDFAVACETAYPVHQGLPNKNKDATLKQYRDQEVEWILRFLRAAEQPYNVGSTDEDKFHEDQQRTFNGKALMEGDANGRYSMIWINARMRMLFYTILRFHEGGLAVYPVGGDSGGYGKPNTQLGFLERLEKIEALMKDNKLIVMNIIEGRGVIALVENPEHFEKRKTQNKSSNRKKDEALEAQRRMEREKDGDESDGGVELEGEELLAHVAAAIDTKWQPPGVPSGKRKRESVPETPVAGRTRLAKKAKTGTDEEKFTADGTGQAGFADDYDTTAGLDNNFQAMLNEGYFAHEEDFKWTDFGDYV